MYGLGNLLNTDFHIALSRCSITMWCHKPIFLQMFPLCSGYNEEELALILTSNNRVPRMVIMLTKINLQQLLLTLLFSGSISNFHRKG